MAQLHIRLNTSDTRRLADLKASCGAETTSEAVRRAVSVFAEILTLVQSGELLVRDRATGSLQRVSIQGLSRSMLTLEDVSNNVAPIALALDRKSVV